MDASDWASMLALVLVVAVLLASGPVAGGLVQPSGLPTTVDDGDATVANVDVASDDIHVSDGRFGTAVSYVRVPDAHVELASVVDHPRIVYRVEVPTLDADLTATRIVGDRGDHVLHVRDYGLDPTQVTESKYDATLTVRVQSFAVDRTVYERNVTVEVRE